MAPSVEDHRCLDTRLHTLYTRAEQCGIAREQEYLADLGIHLCRKNKGAGGPDAEDVWVWRRYRALFLQKRYTVLLDEIDHTYADVFLAWSLHHNGTSSHNAGCVSPLALRCAYLKCLLLVRALRVSQLRGLG